MLNRQQVCGKIEELLKKVCDLEFQNFSGNLDFIDDLGMDSISMMSLLIEIESCFGIQIPDDQISMENLRSYHKLVDLVMKIINS